MKKSNLLQLCFVLVLVFIAGTMLGPAASNPSTADWQTILQQRLPLYGHRNWIVVRSRICARKSNAHSERATCRVSRTP